MSVIAANGPPLPRPTTPLEHDRRSGNARVLISNVVTSRIRNSDLWVLDCLGHTNVRDERL